MYFLNPVQIALVRLSGAFVPLGKGSSSKSIDVPLQQAPNLLHRTSARRFYFVFGLPKKAENVSLVVIVGKAVWYAINYVLCSFHQCEVMAGFSVLLSNLKFWLTVSMADQQKHVCYQHARTLAENRPIVVYASSKDHRPGNPACFAEDKR